MFIVMEIQTGDSVATIVTQHETKEDAESKFHTILASASVSSVPKHSALILNDMGGLLRSECYVHAQDEGE